jgi:hypothetical protein
MREEWGALKRLTEERLNPDSPEGRLAKLIRAMPPLERVPFAKERAFACLTSAATRPRRSPWAAGAIALGLGVSAFAATAVSHFEFPGQIPASSFASSPVPLTASMPPAPAGGATAEARGTSPETRADAAGIHVTIPAASPTPESKLRARSVERRSPAGGEDPAALLEAIRALRSDGDPARAGVLLAAYLKAYPHSPLSGDALALSIEAAIARHDSRSGAELARRYLAQFPDGRYRSLASRAALPRPPADSP